MLFSTSSKEDLTDEKIKIISKNTNREQLALDLLKNEEEKKIK